MLSKPERNAQEVLGVASICDTHVCLYKTWETLLHEDVWEKQRATAMYS
jgi:hypothetical protein